MNSRRLIICALAAFGSISLASCGDDNKPADPIKDKATITVVDGSGSGEYKIGDQVTVDCVVPDGYEFEAWKEGDNVLSKSKQYTFIASRNITLTATFVEVKLGFDDVRSLKAYLSSINENVKAKATKAPKELNIKIKMVEKYVKMLIYRLLKICSF